jgi:hypothetical protein
MNKPRIAALAVATTLLVGVLPGATASAAPPLRLHLVTGADHVDLYRYGREKVMVDIGAFLGASGATFEVQVRRDPLGPDVHGVWAGPSGDVPIPDELLHGWRGLRRFFWIAVYRHGELVRQRAADFCPNTWDLQRLDDAGPTAPTFPDGCGGFHPFTLGMPWGIDQGWAATTMGARGGPMMRLDRGRYTVVLQIRPVFRRLFDIDPADAEVEVTAHVRSSGGGCIGCPHRRATGVPTPFAAVPTDTSPGPATVPDLAALPAYAVAVEGTRRNDFLSFAANVWNRGPTPLLVEGFRQPGADLMDAYQYFSWNGNVVGRAPVGAFEFEQHADHSHWHFQQFARYRLLDPSLAQVVRSRKASFCLAPTDAIDLLVPNAARRVDELGFSQCGGPSAIWIRETLPVGWGDTYYQGIFGQAFNITDVPNGSYFIEVAANPQGVLYDADASNDVALRQVILGGSPGARTVTVPPWNGIDA